MSVVRGDPISINGTDAFRLSAGATNSYFGYSVDCADVTGDGGGKVVMASLGEVSGGSTVGRTSLYNFTPWGSTPSPIMAVLRSSPISGQPDVVAAVPGVVVVGASEDDADNGEVHMFTAPWSTPTDETIVRPDDLCSFGVSLSITPEVLAVGGKNCAVTLVRSVLLFPRVQTLATTISTAGSTSAAATNSTSITSSSLTPSTTSVEITTVPSTAPEQGSLGAASVEDGSSVDARLIAGLGSACVVLLALVLIAFVWRRRKRGSPSSSTIDESSHHRVGRPSRSSSKARVSRSTSRHSVAGSQRAAPRTAYGETSLAIIGERSVDQYAQTSLYPQPSPSRVALVAGAADQYAQTSLYPQPPQGGSGVLRY